jgi:hypothetical protein
MKIDRYTHACQKWTVQAGIKTRRPSPTARTTSASHAFAFRFFIAPYAGTTVRMCANLTSRFRRALLCSRRRQAFVGRQRTHTENLGFSRITATQLSFVLRL